MAVQKMLLDHVVLLLPFRDVVNPPQWLTKHFTISQGGRHADGKTENRLVLFRDGTYLELIAFVDDDNNKRKGHWWGSKPYGVMDYAFTTQEPRLDYEALDHRLENAHCALRYAKPQAGGRHRPDGVELKWEVTFPQGESRGDVPFFCQDVTPRERRVPVTEENTTHPCGALGMGGVVAEVDGNRVNDLGACLAAIVGVDPQEKHDYTIGAPHEIAQLPQPSIELKSKSQQAPLLTLLIRTAEGEAAEAICHRIGDDIVSICFEQ